jgi:hypothetical protein
MTRSSRTPMTLTERFEHAYRVMSSPRFLEMEGLGNEVGVGPRSAHAR